MKKKLFVEPMGGLANRIRVIATAVVLARQLDRTLFIVWSENQELNCAWPQIFEHIDGTVIVNKSRKYFYIERSKKFTGIKRILQMIKNRVIGFSVCITDQEVLQNKNNITDLVREANSVYIKTCFWLNNSAEGYQLFTPILPLRQKIIKIAQTFRKPTVGLQVRRTDNQQSIEHSPLKMFVDRAHEIIAKDPEVIFFLSTDDPSTEICVKDLLHNRLIVRKKDFSRQTVSGIQDAVIDLFLLSLTDKILGSYWSSFSEVAAEIGGNKLEVIKAEPGMDN